MYDRLLSRLDKWLPTAVMLSLGVLMILYGGSSAYVWIHESYTVVGLIRIISSVIMAVFGVIIILDGSRTLLKTTVMFTLALGLYRAISYYLTVQDRLLNLDLNPVSVFTEISSIAVVIYYIFMLIFALLMFVTALAIAMGFDFRRNSLMYTCILMVVSATFRIWYVSALEGWKEIFTLTNGGRVLEIVMFTMALWAFDSDEVRLRETSARHMTRMKNIRNSYVSDNARHILPDVAGCLMDPERRNWRLLMDCGPVLREFQFVIIGKADNRNIVLVQEWRDDPVLHVSVCGTESNTVLFPNNFLCECICREGDDILFASKSGVNLRVPVRDTKLTDIFGVFKERDL